MKKLTLVGLFAALFVTFASLGANAQNPLKAQNQNPVKWTASVQMTSETEGIVTLSATIDEGWHIYGTKATDDGPIPTKLKFTGSGIKYAATTYCKPGVTTMDDPVFGCQVTYWENKVRFTRKFTLTDPAKAKVSISVTYMCCNDANCRPPVTETFEPAITK